MTRKDSTASSSVIKTFSPNSSKAASDYAVKKTRRGICALRHPRPGSEKARGAGKNRPYGRNGKIKGSPDSDGPKKMARNLPIKRSAANRKHDSGGREKKPRIEHGVSTPVRGDVVKSVTGHPGSTNQTQPSIMSECPFKIKYQERGTSMEWAVESQTDSKWEDLDVLKSYTRFIGGTHMMTIKPGVYVLVNHSSISYGKDLTPEDEQKLWVAYVHEVRSGSEPTPTFLLVHWMYWPHELPEGAEHYHGKQELVASTWQDIIDVDSVSNTVNVTYWDEKYKVPKGWYWRQKFYPERKTLSTLDTYCICGRPENPDGMLIHCNDCGIWLHGNCLVDNMYSRLNIFDRNNNAKDLFTVKLKVDDVDSKAKNEKRDSCPRFQIEDLEAKEISEMQAECLDCAMLQDTSYVASDEEAETSP